MAVKKIIHAPHPTLRQQALIVDRVDAKILEFATNVRDTLLASIDPPGVGLAAPQIDKKWRLFVTALDDAPSGQRPTRLFVNPQLIDKSDRLTLGVNHRRPDLEGCLSIPHLYGPVERPEWATFQWQEITADGTELSEWHTATFYDFAARVMLHELDHLNGILFTDHILQQGQPLYESHQDELREVEPEIARGY